MDYLKHKDRDLELPAYQKVLKDLIEQDLLKDDRVLGLFYGGSIGSESTDLYSDIDLRVVVSLEDFEDYVSNKKVRSQNWGNVLFYEDPGPNVPYTIAHFDCFVKVDVFYFTPEQIRPSIWLKDIHIVKDLRGGLTEVLNESLNLVYKPTKEDVESWRNKFLAHFHESYRRVMRGEYYYALNCVDSMRHMIVSGWYMKQGMQPNTLGDWAKYEGERSELDSWQQSLLEGWQCGRSKKEIMTVRRSLAEEFKAVHGALCDQIGVEEDFELIDKIIKLAI
ncbi:aminoglycoside 6-adenylyltransferase [Alkalibacillus haloalkaliphilus]|uniref:aminoglycoside 6-adenylyltransferase n=1 Tax=Alkalibacillus haloalkaliphilus TaxID=94136 RepID=UPI00030339D9|nr:aminoglycoside 6-adenylyltransferase [Alkalibacillus haloalkaliphilus]